jgi:transcriptional regulator with XRE-family HTH domain
MLADQLKTIRKHKGYSQQRLAEKSGLSLRTVQRVENGETQPRGDTLIRLTDALDVNPNEIMEWKKKEDKTYLSILNLSAFHSSFFQY